MQYFKYDKVQIVKDVYDDKQEINWKGCVGFIVDISSRNDEYPIEVTLTKNSQFKTLSFKIDEIELIEE